MFELHKFLPHPHDPFQSPAWRWLRCQYLLEYGHGPIPKLDDGLTRDAWRFLRELWLGLDDAARERLTERSPIVAA
ncbi:MAG: hypothetical protein ACYC3I_17510, partial [Gemmataceae bacterium]